MKATNIDWLPSIPDNWSVVRLKDIAKLQSGNGITSADIDEVGDYPVYGGNGLRGYTTSYTNEGDYVLIGRQGALCGNINYAYGNCLGYVDDDNSDRIYALNGESTDEWLIEYYVTGIMEEPAILREITTKNKKEIPSSVESFDYDYWK